MIKRSAKTNKDQPYVIPSRSEESKAFHIVKGTGLNKEVIMSSNLSVKINSRYQITIPRLTRQQLNIKPGDRLLVDIQDGVMVLIPQPQDFAKHMAGLHKGVWEGIDTTEYLQRERGSWKDSAIY